MTDQNHKTDELEPQKAACSEGTCLDEGKAELADRTGAAGVPRVVVGRLSLYLRELQRLLRDGQETTSSSELAAIVGGSATQVRKDLASFGQFGYPGVGYRCRELVAAISGILGVDRQWNVAIIGVGNLGRALMGYRGFHEQGFQVSAAFDIDPEKTGREVEGVPVFPLAELPQRVVERKIRLAALAVPAAVAQTVADQVVAAGLQGVLNFAPVTLALPPQITKVEVDLAIELKQLAFAVVQQEEKS